MVYASKEGKFYRIAKYSLASLLDGEGEVAVFSAKC